MVATGTAEDLIERASLMRQGQKIARIGNRLFLTLISV